MVVKETILFDDTAFYGLACPDIHILLSDLNSPKNFVYGSKRNYSVW